MTALHPYILGFYILLLLPIGLLGQTPSAPSPYLDSLKNSLSKSTPLEAVGIYATIAEKYNYSGAPDSMRAYTQKAYHKLAQLKERTAKEEAYTLIIEAVIRMNLDSFSNIALDYIKSPERRARIFLEMDSYHHATKDYTLEKCLDGTDSVAFYLNKMPKQNDSLWLAYYAIKSNCYQVQLDLLGSLRTLREAEVFITENAPKAVGIYNAQAHIYYQLKAFEQALDFATKAKILAAQSGAHHQEATAIFHSNDAAFALKKYDLIKTNAERFIQLNKTRQGNDLSRIYIMLGKTALQEGKVNQAETYFTTGLSLKGQNILDISGCHEGLSRVYYLKNNLEKAKYHANESLKMNDPKEDFDSGDRVRELAKVYAKTQDFQKAYELVYLDINQKIKSDSINDPYKIVGALLQDNFEQEKSLLEYQLDYQQQLGKQRLLMASAFAMIAFLVFLYFYNRSKNRKLKVQVQEQTQEIRAKNERLAQLDQFKSRLYTNITHEFRTPLTVISGLVEQLKGDKSTKKIIKRNSDQLLNLVNQLNFCIKINDISKSKKKSF